MNTKYTRLEEYDADHETHLAGRVYHGDTLKHKYVDTLIDNKLHPRQYRDRCAIGSTLDTDLKKVGDELRDDKYGYGIANPNN